MPSKAPLSVFAAFQQNLVGNWANVSFGKDTNDQDVGGPSNPLSYNLMPLPQASDPDGYILKNFKFTERLHFNDAKDDTTLAIAARAANRGGSVDQDARVLFYEQQVRFAEGPQGPRPSSPTGDVVHVENGAWLYLPRYVQSVGPYPNGPTFGPPDKLPATADQQPRDMAIAKQISIPHGNSILALGSFTMSPDGNPFGDPFIAGSPMIPDSPPPFPTPLGQGTPALNVMQRYKTVRTASASQPNDFENPHPDLTLNPNLQLQEAVRIINPDKFIHLFVTAKQPAVGDDTANTGNVTNIPFEQRLSEVTTYATECWMLFKGDDRYLSYSQTILLTLTIKNRQYSFPHLTANTVKFIPETL